LSTENVTIMTIAASRALSAARRTCRLDRATIRRMPPASTGVTGSSASILARRRNRDVEVEARGFASNHADGPRHGLDPPVPANHGGLPRRNAFDSVSAVLGRHPEDRIVEHPNHSGPGRGEGHE